jgi:glutamine synthetase
MPWTDPPRAQVLLTLHELDGTSFPVDPRHVLARQIERLAARGLRAAGALELEFFLLDAERDANGRLRPAAAALDRRRSDKTQVYTLDELDGMQPLFAEIYACAKAQGLPLETLISEYAPGQYELTLHYRDDIARAADDMVMLKRMVRGFARKRGMVACFMAKPFADVAGSGMHLHVSVVDRHERNVFAEQAPQLWPEALLHALGGMRMTMAESMLVFAPHANSWRRFHSQSYAPMEPNWGYNNRSVALRIPAGPATARRIEHRAAGVDANPYLVAAAVLAAVQHGWDHRIDPGPASSGNAYQGGESSDVPRDWRTAIERARGSVFLRDALGERAHGVFLAIKEAECARVARTVPELDYELYLHSV